ncbi:hypothetical protein GWI33_021845 [Rhynchophorus ferrugineus]|uniref:Uncharacterized protein n=1 Tax=Rhynchophorus ferrugineus TaxID=354439 RepID=A0A834IQX0_RHYFE|nr:hypothetical protein GWI33_021845 [Rhynchophorus ferrugineus]
MSTEDGERSGRPKEVVTDGNIKRIHKMILNGQSSVQSGCRGSSLDQKQRQVDDSEQCLKMIKRNKPEFLRRYVTMEETRLHHFTPKSNRQSSEWTAHHEPSPKRGKTQQSAGKVMASVF